MGGAACLAGPLLQDSVSLGFVGPEAGDAIPRGARRLCSSQPCPVRQPWCVADARPVHVDGPAEDPAACTAAENGAKDDRKQIVSGQPEEGRSSGVPHSWSGGDAQDQTSSHLALAPGQNEAGAVESLRQSPSASANTAEHGPGIAQHQPQPEDAGMPAGDEGVLDTSRQQRSEAAEEQDVEPSRGEVQPSVQLNLSLGLISQSLAAQEDPLHSQPDQPARPASKAAADAPQELLTKAGFCLMSEPAAELHFHPSTPETMVAPSPGVEEAPVAALASPAAEAAPRVGFCPSTLVECPDGMAIHLNDCARPAMTIPETQVLHTLLPLQGAQPASSAEPMVPAANSADALQRTAGTLEHDMQPALQQHEGGQSPARQTPSSAPDAAAAARSDACEDPVSVQLQPPSQPPQAAAPQQRQATQLSEDYVHDAEGTQRSALASDVISRFNMALHQGRVEGGVFHCIQGADLNAATTAVFQKKAKSIAEVVRRS